MPLSLDQVIDLAATEAAKNADVTYPTSATRVESRAGLVHTPDGAFKLGALAHRQMAVRAGIRGGAYDWLLEENRDELHQIVEEYWAKRAASSTTIETCLRLRQQPEGHFEVRAALTGRYARIDNVHVLQGLKQILPPHLASAPFEGMKNQAIIDSRTGNMNCKFLLPVSHPGIDGNDAHQVGVVCRNNELGGGSVRTATTIGRFFCTNQLTSLDNEIKIRHLGEIEGVERILEPLHNSIQQAIRKGPEMFRAYWNTREIGLENPEGAVLELATSQDLSKRAAAQIVGTTLPENIQILGSNAYAVVQSLTQFARDLEDREKASLVEAAAYRMIQLPVRRWAPWQ